MAADRAAALVDGLDDNECAPLLETLWWLATAEDVLERWEACERHTDRALRLARTFGVGYVFVALMHAAPIPLGWRGLHTRAREAAAAALDAAHLSGSDSSLVYAHTVQCFTHAQAGEANLAIRAGEAAVEGGRRLSPGIFVALPHVNLDAALLEAGAYERGARTARRGGLCTARAHHHLGDAAAREWLQRAAATAEEMGLIGRRGAVMTLEAELANSAPMALEAAELLREGGRVSDAARARMAAGRMLGDIPELQRARAAFLECGAPRLADQAASELRRLGLRVARAGARAGTLSAREQEIAELVGIGRTNREIAAELHLSESTVENHLSRVYRKLGISSRAALAALISGGNAGNISVTPTEI